MLARVVKTTLPLTANRRVSLRKTSDRVNRPPSVGFFQSRNFHKSFRPLFSSDDDRRGRRPAPKGVREMWATARQQVEDISPSGHPIMVYVNSTPRPRSPLFFIVRGIYLVWHNQTHCWPLYRDAILKKRITTKQLFAAKRHFGDLRSLVLFAVLNFATITPEMALLSTVVLIGLLLIKPSVLLPGTIVPPTRKDVSEFIEYCLEEHDELKMGYVNVVIARRVLEYLDPTLTDSDISALMKQAGMSADGSQVNYVKLSLLPLE